MSSAKGFSVSVFGLFTLPDLVRPNEDLAEVAVEVHEIVAYTMIVMIGLHFAGAMKHHVIDRDSTLRRMLPRIFNR
jgi:cytochrome b561